MVEMSDVETAKSVSEKEQVEESKTTFQKVWHYIWLTCRTVVRAFKGFCQVVVIFYQFLTLLYQYPNSMGYAIKITYNSLLVCYQTGLWDPFSRKPTKDVSVTKISSASSKKSNVVKKVAIQKDSSKPEKILTVLPAAVPTEKTN